MNWREEKEGDGFSNLSFFSPITRRCPCCSVKPLFPRSYLESLAVLSPTNCDFSWSKLAPRGIACKPVPHLISVVRNRDGGGKSSRPMICLIYDFL